MPDAKAKLMVRVVDGTRRPFADDVLISLFDGAQRRVHWAYHSSPFTEFTIPVTDGPLDVYRVVAGAKDCRDAGQMGIPLKEGAVSFVDLMLLPKRGSFKFEPLETLASIHPKLLPLVKAFLKEKFGGDDQEAYERLQENEDNVNKVPLNTAEGLATLLSISSGFAGFGDNGAPMIPLKPAEAVKSHPLDFVSRLVELKADRFFAEVESKMVTWLSSDSETFNHAPFQLHPGAFLSFKEQRYPEGNVQFTFIGDKENPNYTLDSDIDLFKDQFSHGLLEVFPADVLHILKYTDPRDAYVLRWMSVQRLKIGSGIDFNPPYFVVPSPN